MILYAAQGTANLGDFFNSMPVLSGISKSYGSFDLIIQSEMAKFNGIKELVEHQPFINSVKFEHEISSPPTELVIAFNSWVREEQLTPNRPIETCRYEIRFKETYHMKFDTDDDFILQIPDIDVKSIDTDIIGDRCSHTTADKRRSCDLLKSFNYKGYYLDYTKSLTYNLNLIKKSKFSFITTITGISVLVDLMGLSQKVAYDSFMETWDNRPNITATFNKHYYNNRKTELFKLD